MTDKSTQEMICAFAAGCMDQKNYAHFKEYMDSEKDLPYSDLGEMQNIMAMIPIILETEKPNPELKTKVAKRLLEITEEIKTKKRLDKKKTITDLKHIKHTSSDSPRSEHPTPRITLVGGEKAKDDSRSKKTLNENNDIFSKHMNNKYITSVKNNTTPQKTKTPSYLPYVILLIVIVGLGVATYFLHNANAEMETNLNELRSELESIRMDFNVNQRFINNHMSLIEFFHYNDIAVVNLERSDSSRASGKLFLSFEEREALVQVNNLPPLGPDQVFELWFESKGVSISMGVFIPQQNQNYIKVTSFPTVAKTDIDLFTVTIEPAAGSESPSGNQLLSGKFTTEKQQAPPVRQRRLW